MIHSFYCMHLPLAIVNCPLIVLVLWSLRAWSVMLFLCTQAMSWSLGIGSILLASINKSSAPVFTLIVVGQRTLLTSVNICDICDTWLGKFVVHAVLFLDSVTFTDTVPKYTISSREIPQTMTVSHVAHRTQKPPPLPACPYVSRPSPIITVTLPVMMSDITSQSQIFFSFIVGGQ